MSTIYPFTTSFERERYIPKDPLSPLLKAAKLLKINGNIFLSPERLDQLCTAYDNINFCKKMWGAREVGSHIERTCTTAQKIDSFTTLYDFANALSTCSATVGFFNARFLIFNNYLDEPLTIINFAETATEYQCGKIKDPTEKWTCIAKRVAALVALATVFSIQLQITIGTFNTALGIIKYCLDEHIRYNAFCEKRS